jgi:hypothetical protein
MNLVNALIDHGVRFDHRDPGQHNASLIQRLRSLRELFGELADSPDHRASRGIIRRRLQGTEQAIEKYESLVAQGAIDPADDAPQPTGGDIADQLEAKLKDLPGVGDALQELLRKLREEP